MAKQSIPRTNRKERRAGAAPKAVSSAKVARQHGRTAPTPEKVAQSLVAAVVEQVAAAFEPSDPSK